MSSYRALSRTFFQDELQDGKNILLVNPPVIDHRYAWVKWNQPLDLLNISSYLKKEKNCKVKLFDFMQPKKSKVRRSGVTRPNHLNVNGVEFRQYYWGKSISDFRQYLEEQNSAWIPDYVIFTTLTSYWWRGVHQALNEVHTMFPSSKCVLYGNYAIYESDHASIHVFPDLILTDYFTSMNEFSADFTLYEDQSLDFCALNIGYNNWEKEISKARLNGVNKFIFYVDWLFKDPDNDFLPKLKNITQTYKSEPMTKQPSFIGICGLYPDDIDMENAKALIDANFRDIHLEHNYENGRPDIKQFEEAKRCFDSAYNDANISNNGVGAFLMIGTPNENIDNLVEDLYSLHEVVGHVILKPYTPQPNSDFYSNLRTGEESLRLELLSPHLFPMSNLNGISPNEYQELYSLASLLNHRVRGNSWDLFPGELGFELFAKSMKRKVWDINNG